MTAGLARFAAVAGQGLADLSDLVLARTCAGCGASGSRWCGACASSLHGPASVRVVAGVTVHSVAVYEDALREAVNAWKDHGRADLTAVLADVLATLVRAVLAETSAGGPPHRAAGLVPVPSSPGSRRSRGREPVRELARATAARVGRDRVVVLAALAQRRRVAEQAGLGADDRARNLDGALHVPTAWARQVEARQVVLVDDVVTSGATLREASRALAAAGADVLGAVTVAATARRPAGRPQPS